VACRNRRSTAATASACQLDLLRFLIRIAGNEAHPANAFELACLRGGLQILGRLLRRGRPAATT
jgi:hypothetical protein